MNILLLPDKFKDSLSASQVIECMIFGIKKIIPNSSIQSFRLADGGDGFLDAIVANESNVTLSLLSTVNARGNDIKSQVGLDYESKTVYIEMAHSSGIAQLKPNERDALLTSTYGTGVLIKKAIEMGFKTIYIGLGGSATNDGGCGMAVALGYRFLDIDGNSFIPTAKNLIKIRHIQQLYSIDQSISIIAINDVKNPLLGERGATFIYGPQKGLKKEDLEYVDKGMAHLNNIVKNQLSKSYADIPGTGAAGGLGYGLKAFFDAKFIEGIDFFIQKINLQKILSEKHFDLILTAEGKLDDQTIEGKLIMGISELGSKQNIPVVAFCGKNGLSKISKEDLKLDDIIEISDPNQSLEFNLKHADEMLKDKTEEFILNWISKTN